MNRTQAHKKLQQWEIDHPGQHFHSFNVAFNVAEQVWECDSLDKTHRVSSFSLDSLVNNFPYVIREFYKANYKNPQPNL